MPTPFAFVDLDQMMRNIEAVEAQAEGKPIRVASKSIRCRSLLQKITQRDQWSGILCFTVQEAIFLSQHGFDDLLVAYPTAHAGALEAAARAIAGGAGIILMADSSEHIEHCAAAAASVGTTIPLCLELDVATRFPGLYFGVKRSPLYQIDTLVEHYKQIEQTPGLRFDGVMAYEAQIAGIQDALPGKGLMNSVMRILKGRSVQRIADLRREAVKALRDAGANPRIINGGGTGSLHTTAKEGVVNELTVGSGLYNSVLFDYYKDFNYHPAAGFALEVCRKPDAQTVTCLGGGYVASGSVALEKQPQVWLPEGLRLTKHEGAGEVQTPLVGAVDALSLGDPVFFRHAKAGELCERFDRLYLIENDKLIGSTPTYRGEGGCFL